MRGNGNGVIRRRNAVFYDLCRTSVARSNGRSLLDDDRPLSSRCEHLNIRLPVKANDSCWPGSAERRSALHDPQQCPVLAAADARRTQPRNRHRQIGCSSDLGLDATYPNCLAPLSLLRFSGARYVIGGTQRRIRHDKQLCIEVAQRCIQCVESILQLLLPWLHRFAAF